MLGNGRRWVGAVLLGACTGALAGPGYWSGSGPWGGVTYDVHVPSGPSGATTAYAVTRGGVFRTVDGGLSWSRADIGIPGGLIGVDAFALDDLVPATLISVDSQNRVVRSTDAGDNWLATGQVVDPALYPAALADVPGDSSGLYLALRSFNATAPADVLLQKSADGGASFSAVPPGAGLPAGLGWYAVAVDPAVPSRVLVGADSTPMGTSGVPAAPSLYRSTDAGATWTPVLSVAGYEDYIPAVLDIAFGAGATVYASTEVGIYRSDDDGATWNGPYQEFSLAWSLHAHPVDALTVLIGTSEGLLRSTDGGATATPLGSGLGSNPTYTSVLDGTTVLTSDISGLAAESGWPSPGTALWASTSGGGIFRSTDGGTSWTANNQGIGATNVRALAVHPNPSTVPGSGEPGNYIYAGFGDAFRGSPALFRSTNFGTTWSVLNSQLRASQIRAIAIDPTTAGLTGPDISSSVIYAAGGPAVVDGYVNSGLYKSSNGGVTWTTLDGNLPTRTFGSQTTPFLGTVRQLVLDPRSCTVPLAAGPCGSGPLLRVYATTSGHTYLDVPSGIRYSSHRIIRSDDGGGTWTALDGDLPASTAVFTSGVGSVNQAITPLSLVLSNSDPDVLYVGTFTGYNGYAGATFDDRETGVFRSSDGGVTWEQRSGGLPRVAGYTNTVVDVLALAIHPLDDDILWATAYDLQGGSSVPSLYKTVDGGLTWLPSASGIPAGIDLRALVVDPGDPDILYASGYYPSGDDGSGGFANPPGVFRSDDGGATWLSISGGLQARSVLAMTLDPFQPHVLHLGTNTGVWSMEQVPDTDGDGASDAAENFAPGGGDGDGDGQQDATQGAVGSTVIIFGGAASAKSARAKGAGGYVTTKVAPLEGTCTQSVDVEAVLAARYGRDYLEDGVRYHTYPRDLVRFEVMQCTRAQVDLIFHNADFAGQEGWTFRMYGPSTPGDDTTVGWHDLSSRAEVVDSNRWRLTLDVDETGSFRGEGESILFMGGPACHDTRIFQDTFETGYVPPPGCDD